MCQSDDVRTDVWIAFTVSSIGGTLEVGAAATQWAHAESAPDHGYSVARGRAAQWSALNGEEWLLSEAFKQVGDDAPKGSPAFGTKWVTYGEPVTGG